MVRITVSAGNHDRIFTPVSADLPAQGDTALELIDQESQRAVPFQLDATGTRITWLIDHLAAGQSRTYALCPASSTAVPPATVSLTEVPNDRVEVRIGDELITSYYYGSAYPRPFLYPLIGPYGASVTRHFPMQNIEGERQDHKHHRSVYTAYGDVNGVDDWSEEPGHGRIVHTGFQGLEQGPVYATIRSQSDWVSNSGEKVMSESRTVTIYGVPSAARVLDYEVRLTASVGEVKFGDTKEGGILSVRVATSMDAARGGKIENSYGGVNEKETWGKRAEWCDYSGPVEGKWVGIAVMDHPGNFRYPTYWHVRDYGLMTANMFGLSAFYNDPQRRGDYTLPEGESLVFRYRIYVHPGDATQGRVAARYHDFVNPPVVTVEA